MRRKLTKNEYMLSALFAFVAAFPLATSADGRWFNVEPLASITSSSVDNDFLEVTGTGSDESAVIGIFEVSK